MDDAEGDAVAWADAPESETEVDEPFFPVDVAPAADDEDVAEALAAKLVPCANR